MSELDLPSLAERAKKENDLTLTTPMKQIDQALKACTFGRFHIKLLACAFVGFVTGVLVSNTTAFLLPSAECDLNMTLVQKGLLNAMPYIGMLLSSVVAGFLTDAFGRKIFLYTGFSGIFVVTLIAASSQSYEVLVTAKFFEGLLFATSFSPLVTLTSEFCHHGIRDQVMLCQSSFASISQIVVSGMAWGILTNDWKYTLFDGKFVLNTWNFYLYAMSLWSLAAWIMYGVLLPESPKYLLTQRKYDEAREILIKIYRENTGKPADTYPFYNLWREKTQEALDEAEEETSKGIAHQIVVGLHNIKPMFRKPLVGNLILICSVNFNLMSMYNVFRLWYPQISTIVENYDMTAGEDLCVVLDQYTSSLKAAALNTTTDAVCLPSRMGDETFINSMIIGCVCILPYFITGILVKKVGKKRLLIVASFVCIAGTIWIRWANSKVAVVALFAVNIALAQVMMSLNQTITVQVFPTTVRTLAISLMMVSGRIGTLTGNIGFPILLNMGCVTPFFTIAGIMVCVTVMSFFLPTK